MVITCGSNFAIHEAQSKAALKSLENLIEKTSAGVQCDVEAKGLQ